MSAKLIDILGRRFPGGWSTDGDQVIALDGQAVPSAEEIESHRASVEAEMAAEVSRATARTALREQWNGLPDFIRGPYREKFEAANQLLDEGDDAAAAALIEYTTVNGAFTAEQVAVFDAAKAAFLAAIEGLPG